MIVRINGVALPDASSRIIEDFVVESYNKKDIKKLKKLSVWLWSISGTMMVQSPTLAAGTSNLWIQMKPVFGIFQEIGMVLGAFAIISGLIVMIFKRRLATKIISTAAVVVGGVFLVPSIIMLIAIIGSMMNDALTAVFSTLDFGGSVKVGK